MLTHVGIFSVDFNRIDTGKTVCFLVSGGLCAVVFFSMRHCFSFSSASVSAMDS